MSGHHLPIKSSKEIKDFFERNNGQQFIEHFPLPSFRWAEGGLNRLNYFHLNDVFNRKTKLGAKLINTCLKMQKFLGIKRKPLNTFPKLYGGSAWWSLSSSCVRHAINEIDKDPSFLKRLKHTLCPEEVLFQTILMNSHYKHSIIGNNTLTLMLWEYRNGNSPANLDKSDFPMILKSTKLFARRFEYPTSQSLVELIKKDVNQKEVLDDSCFG